MQQSQPDFLCQPQSPNNNLSALRIKKTCNDMEVLEAISIVKKFEGIDDFYSNPIVL